jgi:hypothetical protein
MEDIYLEIEADAEAKEAEVSRRTVARGRVVQLAMSSGRTVNEKATDMLEIKKEKENTTTSLKSEQKKPTKPEQVGLKRRASVGESSADQDDTDTQSEDNSIPLVESTAPKRGRPARLFPRADKVSAGNAGDQTEDAMLSTLQSVVELVAADIADRREQRKHELEMAKLKLKLMHDHE